MSAESDCFRAEIAQLGYSQSSFAREMRALGDPREVKVILRNIANYCTGATRVPGEMSVILRLLHDRAEHWAGSAPL